MYIYIYAERERGDLQLRCRDSGERRDLWGLTSAAAGWREGRRSDGVSGELGHQLVVQLVNVL